MGLFDKLGKKTAVKAIAIKKPKPPTKDEQIEALTAQVERLSRSNRQLGVQAAAGFEMARKLQNQVQATTQMNGELLNVLAENAVDPEVAVQLAQAALECKRHVAVGVDALQAAISVMKDDTQGAYTQLVRPAERLIDGR